jgi:hypothetical protein
MMKKTLRAALGACSLWVLAPVSALAQEASPYSLEWDNFANGFTVDTPEAKWNHFVVGPYRGDDGIATTSSSGLHVIAKGTNPTTGKPAFTRTTGQEGSTGSVAGDVDHIKWMVNANHTASSGYPGFDAIRGQELACETWISGQTFGTRFHPFGKAVSNHNDDLRLASFAHTTIDAESAMVFDFFFTNEQVYAFYERLPFARTPENQYAAFSYMIPVAKRNPDSVHHTKIAYDRAAGVARWVLDGREVFRVNRVGRHINRDYLTIDRGGVEQDVELRQLNCGMGLFTLLDGYLPSRAGLVRLSDSASYFLPPLGQPVPLTFVDEQSKLSSRLFGQGAEIKLQRYVVSSVYTTASAQQNKEPASPTREAAGR